MLDKAHISSNKFDKYSMYHEMSLVEIKSIEGTSERVFKSPDQYKPVTRLLFFRKTSFSAEG